MARDCKHTNFNFSEVRGGYVQCADCGKSVPVEQVLASLSERIEYLERITKTLAAELVKGASHEVRSEV